MWWQHHVKVTRKSHMIFSRRITELSGLGIRGHPSSGLILHTSLTRPTPRLRLPLRFSI